MAVTIKSEMACVVVCKDVSINPQSNTLSDSEYSLVRESNTFKELVKSGKFFVVEDSGTEIEESDEVKEVGDMSVKELREYAKSLELKIPTGASKEEIIELISSVEG